MTDRLQREGYRELANDAFLYILKTSEGLAKDAWEDLSLLGHFESAPTEVLTVLDQERLQFLYDNQMATDPAIMGHAAIIISYLEQAAQQEYGLTLQAYVARKAVYGFEREEENSSSNDTTAGRGKLVDISSSRHFRRVGLFVIGE